MDTKWLKDILIISLALVGLTFLFSLKSSSTAIAQGEAVIVGHVRDFDPDSIGTLNPVGLAFSPVANEFLVLEAGIPAQPPSPVSNFIRIIPTEERRGSVAIGASINDPINIAFDSKGQRLLFLHSARSNLFEVRVDQQGNLDPTTQRPYNAQQFGIQDPQGMAVDPISGRLFILDGAGPRLLRITPDVGGDFTDAVVSEVDLGQTGLVNPRGLALDPTTGHLHIMSPAQQELYEVTETGQVVAIHAITEAELNNPQAMVFAPSGDLTDDPSQMNLYLADSGQTSTTSGLQSESAEALEAGQLAAGSGKIVELAFRTVVAAATADFTSDLVQTIEAFRWSPPSPDSSGVVYLPASNTLMVSDGEVNEMPIYAGANVFEATLAGNLIDTFTTLSFGNNEPTGITVNPANNHLFISQDTPPKAVYEMEPGPDGLYDTADDIVTSLVTADFGATDPEGVTFASGLGVLFIADGLNNEIYQLAPGANGIFDGVPPAGDDQVVNQFDTFNKGMEDPEGVAYNPANGNLYIAGKTRNIGTRNFDTLLEVTTSGNLVQTIDVSAANPGNNIPKQKLSGLAVGPCSNNASATCIYIADRGEDNNNDPNENDGRVYEMTLLGGGPSNIAPTANDDSASTTEGVAVTIDAAANDTDPNGNLVPASANTTCANGSAGCSGPTNGTLVNNNNGTFTYTPNGSFAGNDGFVYEICDTEPLCDTATVTINVSANVPPVANDDSASTTTSMLVTIDAVANDTDPNGNLDPASTNTSCATCSTPANGTLVNKGDGSFDYTPNGSFTGNDGFIYEICDTLLACSSATVTITVSEPPSFGTIYASSTSGGTVGGVAFKDEDILAYDPSTGTWSMYFDGSDVGLDASGQEITALHINSDGSILLSLGVAGIIPDVGAVDDHDIVRFIPTSTGDVTAGSYELYFDGEDVELAASSEDIDALGFAPDGRLVISTRGSFSAGGIGGQDEDLFIFTDTQLGTDTVGAWTLYLDGSDVALDASTEDVNGTWIDANGDIYLAARGAFDVTGAIGDAADIFTCVPASTGDNTSCTFSLFWDGSANGFAGEDLNGFFLSGGSGGPSNSGPTANDDPVSTPQDTATLINVVFNDTDPDGNLDPSSAAATSGPSPGSSLTNNGDGTFNYTPEPGYTGPDSFVYQICDTGEDRDGSTDADDLCDTATVNITVTVPNDPPVANDDSISGNEDTVISDNVLSDNGNGGDSDPDGNLDPNSVTEVSGPTAGSLNLNSDGSFDYTPNPHFNGSDSFVYQVCDTLGLCDTATVTLTVNPIADPPIANDDPVSTPQDTAVNIGVAFNDTDPDGDLDPSSATAISRPSPGSSLINNGDGTFTYTPESGYTGSDSFVYQICDLSSPVPLCATATVNITVSGNQIYYVSSTSNGTVGGVAFKDEDILAFDPSTGTWSMFFAGVAAGLPGGADINALHVDVDGSILLSLTSADTIPDVGPIDDSDIVRFIPTTPGDYTAGTFEWYFDGSDVELTSSGEDIDAIGFAPDGRLIISTNASFAVPNISGKDEDLLIFTGISGETASGSFELFLDGDVVGLATSSEDVNGTWIDANGDIYLTTNGAFDVTGATGDGADIFTCVPGSVTSCTFSLFWDGSANGFAGEVMDGLSLAGGSNGPSNSGPTANDDPVSTPQDTATLINVVFNDTDPDGNLDPSSAAATSGPSPGSSLTNNGDGTFNYTPEPGYTGPDSFVYQICDTGEDGDGSTDADDLCDTATVDITVSGQQSVGTIYVSSTSGGTVGGVGFKDEDILAFDISTSTWSMYFDGSDVGLGVLTSQEIDAFHINPDGSILLSLGDPDTIPVIGSVDDHDIVRFIPTLTGDVTAGSYEMYFNGEDFGLEATGEDIDAIGFAPDGRLVISTRGSYSAGGISGGDKNLIKLHNSGLWELYFDGSAVALDDSSEDVTGTWIDTNGDVYLSVRGAFNVNSGVSSLAGDGADIFICTPGLTVPITSCTFSMFWDGSNPANGFGSEVLNGLFLGP